MRDTAIDLLRQAADQLISRDVDYGYHADCLSCGMRTYFEKDSDLQHEPDCVVLAIDTFLRAHEETV